MQTVKFRERDMEITPVGFGSWTIVGSRCPNQVDGIIGAVEVRLSDDEVERIESFIRENQ